jgi:hypothetical protein
VPALLVTHGISLAVQTQSAGVLVALTAWLLLILLLHQILDSVVQLTEQEWQYTLSASCIEVYNNTLR